MIKFGTGGWRAIIGEDFKPVFSFLKSKAWAALNNSIARTLSVLLITLYSFVAAFEPNDTWSSCP